VADDDVAARAGVRQATREDVPAIRGILAAHGNDAPVVHGDIVGPYVRHIVDHHRAFVSELDGEVVAYGAAVDAGVALHLADLFVRADLLGQGLGRPLLASVVGDATSLTTFASADPRALPSYVRAGMAPLWPCLYLEGDGAAIGPPPGLEARDADPAELAELERDWTGILRDADHAFWGSQAAADPFVIADAVGPLALGYARARQTSPDRVLDRLLVRPGADPVGPGLLALGRAARGGAVRASIPGPGPLLPALLERRFRIADQDLYMASAPGLVDPARLLPNPGML